MATNKIRQEFLEQKNNVTFGNRGFNTKFFSESPTYQSYSIFFDFNSPLLNPANSSGESAERYFSRLGDNDRANKVVEFREILLNLMEKTPYLIKELNGLSNVLDYKREEIYLERELEIKTYETLDLRISSLAQLYIAFSWDWEQHRKIIPDNLEWFNMHLIINEIRSLVKFVSAGESGRLDNMNPFIPSRVYTFNKNKFYFGNSESFLGDMKSTDATMAENSLKIYCGKFSMKKSTTNVGETPSSSNSNLLDFSRPTTNIGNKSKSLIDKAKEKLENFASDSAEQLAQRGIDIIKKKAFQELNYNVLYRSETPNALELLSGRQKPKDLVRDFTGNVTEGILSKNVLKLDEDSTENIVNAIINNNNRRLLED